MIEWAFQKEFGVDEKDEIAEFSMFDGDTLWRCVVYCVAGNTKKCTNRVGVSVDAGMHVNYNSKCSHRFFPDRERFHFSDGNSTTQR